MSKRNLWNYSRRAGLFLTAGYLYQQIGCLPDQAFQQVVGQNLVLTFGVIVQSITSIIFNTIFGVI